jgi:protein O-GlcNAc transferase
VTIPQAFQIAVQHHSAGRLADAEALFRQILAVQPYHADALHQLGDIARQVGRNEIAVELIRRAISINPFEARFFVTLARPLNDQGQFDAAIAAYDQAIRMEPTLAEAHNNLGHTLRERGRLGEAVAACRRALQLKPDYPEAHHNLGAALAGQGHVDEAVAAYRRALELKPDIPETYNNLGNALRERGQFDEAVAACRRALELRPDFLAAHNSLGNALMDQGQLDQAVAAFHRALELKPDLPEAHNNLGLALWERGQFDEAVAACRRALELKPDLPGAHNNLGLALKERGQLDEAVAAFRSALQLKPDVSEAHNNLGNTLKDQGELDAAIAAFRQALRFKPDYTSAHSNLVYTLHLHPGQDDRTISEEHQRWNRQFSDPLKHLILPHANDRHTDRRLRIGYVSPDLREHAVGRFVLPLFERHDREGFEILCYSGVARPDWMTERLRALAGPARNASRSDAGGKWRNTVGVSDARLAEMIREDEVDILVDLALHTAGNRLPVFARQPAPVQVSWLAYPGGAGLPGIGYRLTDARMEPPGEEPGWSAGKPVRLPGCWCCYDPVGASPEINALPALSAHGVSFGSLNNFAKVHEGVLALWARVLDAVKGSRLVLFCPEGRTRERVRAFFGARGIAAERMELVGYLPRLDYLKIYQRIDIGLDPFPYNGMTTTFDALWM